MPSTVPAHPSVNSNKNFQKSPNIWVPNIFCFVFLGFFCDWTNTIKQWLRFHKQTKTKDEDSETGAVVGLEAAGCYKGYKRTFLI